MTINRRSFIKALSGVLAIVALPSCYLKPKFKWASHTDKPNFPTSGGVLSCQYVDLGTVYVDSITDGVLHKNIILPTGFTYNYDGDLMIAKGVTMTVEPGATVHVEGQLTVEGVYRVPSGRIGGGDIGVNLGLQA